MIILIIIIMYVLSMVLIIDIFFDEEIVWGWFLVFEEIY